MPRMLPVSDGSDCWSRSRRCPPTTPETGVASAGRVPAVTWLLVTSTGMSRISRFVLAQALAASEW